MFVRSEGDRHRSLTGAHQRPETRPGPHQGTITLCSVCTIWLLLRWTSTIIQLSPTVLSPTMPLTPFCLPLSCSPSSGPVWVRADSSRRGGERHLESPATVSCSGRGQSEDRHTETNTHEDTLVRCSHVCLAITVNKNLLYHTWSGYCSCFQHVVFHHVLIIWVFKTFWNLVLWEER